ncbi:MAG: fimbrillin family protein, partial [Bacteroidaceae bacterium]|nr:fimbrillin family protein [Bacteroidaceae bacterium]
AFEDEGTVLERTITTTLGGTATDIMVIPTGSSATITFNVTVDGTVFTATSAAVELEKGSSYKYTLTLNSTFMSVSDVAVTPWNVVTKESLTLEKPSSWASLANGVYAVAADGSPVTYANADESCIAVALIVNDAPTPQKLMIEKNGEANTTSIKAAYAADGATNTDYKEFYWGMYSSKNTSITIYSIVNASQSYGYLPKADGSYSSTPNLSGDYTTWTSGALSDFNGKANTAAIQTAADTDNFTYYANMGTYCTKFNATATENQGFSDWYIPACGQLSLMYLNITDINEALTAIGGTPLSYYYWSSSQRSSSEGWNVSLNDGLVNNTNKNGSARVRFVRDIK